MLHEHPEDPTALVVGHGAVATAVTVDLRHWAFFVHPAAVGVGELDFAHERLPRAVATQLPEETRCGEVRHSFTQDVATRCFARWKDVAPPLVCGFMCNDHERCVLLSTGLCQESDGLAEDYVCWKALCIAGEPWEFADAELLPRVRPEPLGVPLMRAIECFQHRWHIERVRGQMPDSGAFAL